MKPCSLAWANITQHGEWARNDHYEPVGNLWSPRVCLRLVRGQRGQRGRLTLPTREGTKGRQTESEQPTEVCLSLLPLHGNPPRGRLNPTLTEPLLSASRFTYKGGPCLRGLETPGGGGWGQKPVRTEGVSVCRSGSAHRPEVPFRSRSSFVQGQPARARLSPPRVPPAPSLGGLQPALRPLPELDPGPEPNTVRPRRRVPTPPHPHPRTGSRGRRRPPSNPVPGSLRQARRQPA